MKFSEFNSEEFGLVFKVFNFAIDYLELDDDELELLLSLEDRLVKAEMYLSMGRKI